MDQKLGVSMFWLGCGFDFKKRQLCRIQGTTVTDFKVIDNKDPGFKVVCSGLF